MAAEFHCHRCGACCRWPGIVRVNTDDIQAIAAFLGLSQELFIARHTCLSPDRKGLILSGGLKSPCRFLTPASGCRINSVKPQQCRTFPFGWTVPPEYLRDCPGAVAAGMLPDSAAATVPGDLSPAASPNPEAP